MRPSAATAAAVSVGALTADRGDVGAGLGQRERDALAEAGVGAGDERDLAGRGRKDGSSRLLQLADVEHVHVGVVQVLAAHRPDEGVVRGARAHVDRPRRATSPLPRWRSTMWRVASGSPMKWKTRSSSPQAEVEIDLAAAVVEVRRHGVPDAAGLQHGQAQQQLRRLADGRDDELVDRALVRGLQRAALQRHGLGDRDLLGLEARVRRGRGQIELRRVGGVGRCEA